MVDQSDERLMKKLVPYDLFLQELLQGPQWQVFGNVPQGSTVPANTDVSQQIQILHEVIPVAFGGV